MPVVTEFTVSIDNRPGALAELAETLAAARIRINSLQGLPCGGQGIFQLVTEDTPATHEVFQGAGVEYIVREVLVIQLENRPGALAKVARLLGDAGINIDSVYATLGGQVVLGVDNLERALSLIQPHGIL